jgi:hypothetical protein
MALFVVSQSALSPSVILNLFQDPPVRMPRTDRRASNGAVGGKTPATGPAAKWTLKQVQGDEPCRMVCR